MFSFVFFSLPLSLSLSLHRAHMQTHSAFKHFRCERCNKSFALKSYLNKHYESSCFKDSSKDHHHGNNGPNSDGHNNDNSNGASNSSIGSSLHDVSKCSEENLSPNRTTAANNGSSIGTSATLNKNEVNDKHTSNISSITRSKVLQQNGLLKRKLNEPKLE